MNLALKTTLSRVIACNPKKGERLPFFCNLSQIQLPYFSEMLLFYSIFLSNFISVVATDQVEPKIAFLNSFLCEKN